MITMLGAQCPLYYIKENAYLGYIRRA